MLIQTYEEFAGYVDQTGFLTLSENPFGLPALSSLTKESAWHTGLETDPWQWKSRIASEGRAAYGHILLGKNSFVSLSMYPYLYAAVRRDKGFWELYGAGVLSAGCKRLYGAFVEHPFIAAHDVAFLAGYAGKERAKAERDLISLQGGLFITTCGTARKVGKTGQPYGWPSSAYTLTEQWAPAGLMEAAALISPRDGEDAVTDRLLALNPDFNIDRLRAKLFPFADL